MNKETLGLYIHIPFCVKKCNYCDFCSFPSKKEVYSQYVNALCEQIGAQREDPRPVDSVFFGGGTPSLLSEGDFSRIFAALREKYAFCEDAEITVEANPGTVTKKKLSALRSLGVNRLSMGLQSAEDTELALLGRIHTYADFLESYRAAREAGFQNINIDLMFAIPGQTLKSLEKTLSCVLSLRPSHISAYGLIIEEKTPFGRQRESLALPGDDAEAQMYDLICKTLGDSGYLHYEISNFAMQGKQCRHNLRYWQGGDYLGFGLAAHSLYKGERLEMTEDMTAYLSDPASVLACVERSAEDEREEYIMLGLRTSFGISLSEYRRRFGADFLAGREQKLSLYRRLGYLSFDGDRVFLTERGFFVSNALLCELI